MQRVTMKMFKLVYVQLCVYNKGWNFTCFRYGWIVVFYTPMYTFNKTTPCMYKYPTTLTFKGKYLFIRWLTSLSSDMNNLTPFWDLSPHKRQIVELYKFLSILLLLFTVLFHVSRSTPLSETVNVMSNVF